MSLSEEAEWEEYFLSAYEKINLIKKEIKFAEDDIGREIYKLYDLTKEEIEIIEKNI